MAQSTDETKQRIARLEDEHDKGTNVHDSNSIETVCQDSSRYLRLRGLAATVYALLRMTRTSDGHVL